MSWESLEDEARKHSAPRGPQCSVARMLSVILDEHGPEAVMSIMRTFKNHRLTTTSIRRALESRIEEDYLPSTYTLQRHRNGWCSCPRGDDDE